MHISLMHNTPYISNSLVALYLQITNAVFFNWLYSHKELIVLLQCNVIYVDNTVCWVDINKVCTPHIVTLLHGVLKMFYWDFYRSLPTVHSEMWLNFYFLFFFIIIIIIKNVYANSVSLLRIFFYFLFFYFNSMFFACFTWIIRLLKLLLVFTCLPVTVTCVWVFSF